MAEFSLKFDLLSAREVIFSQIEEGAKLAATRKRLDCSEQLFPNRKRYDRKWRSDVLVRIGIIGDFNSKYHTHAAINPAI
jgi:hypothetical protein